MNPELLSALVTRIQAGQTKEAIETELLATGYTPEQAALAYEAAMTMLSSSATGSGIEVHQAVPDTNQTANTPAVVVLPSIGQLIQQAWAFIQAYPVLLVLFSVSVLIVPVATIIMTETRILPPSVVSLIEGIGSLAGLIMGIIATGSAVYIVVQPPGTVVTVTDGRRWLATRLWAYFVLSIMTTLVVFGGFLLAFIPGIVVGIYIMFSYFVMAKYGQRYLTAITWSHVLVRGHWWSIVGRMLGLFGVFLVAMILIGVIEGLFNAPEVVQMIVYGMILTVFVPFSISVYGQLFIALSAGMNEDIIKTQAEPLRKWYIGLMILGPFGFMAVMGLISFLALMLVMQLG